MKKVFVGLSGGVDSSVAALLLKEQGYDVVGVYMKNWSKDLPGMPCPWKEDFHDAKRVAVQLGINFEMFDFENEYFHKVVEYMIAEYQDGRTPNPDIMCNQEIKFKLFLDVALERGADLIATGHYARVINDNELSRSPRSKDLRNHSESSLMKAAKLLMAKDTNKDQTYFLYRVSQSALQKTLFPLGELTKPEVRKLAEKHGLVTAEKKESMGICFVGKVGIKDFLSQYVTTAPGPIINQHNMVVGEHDGAIFYTIGQRHGLEVGGGLPYYVVGKNMAKNEVYVTTDLQDERLWGNEFTVTNTHWIAESPKPDQELTVRTRHRANLIKVNNIKHASGSDWHVEVADEIRALSPGQSAVFYQGDECLGGGIVV